VLDRAAGPTIAAPNSGASTMAYSPRDLRAAHAYTDFVHTTWIYPTADALATVAAAGYFADALVRGVRDGDEIIVKVFVPNVAGDIIQAGETPDGTVTQLVATATARRKFVNAAGVFSLAVLD
jgi:hypothetical protein